MVSTFFKKRKIFSDNSSPHSFSRKGSNQGSSQDHLKILTPGQNNSYLEYCENLYDEYNIKSRKSLEPYINKYNLANQVFVSNVGERKSSISNALKVKPASSLRCLRKKVTFEDEKVIN